MILPLFLVISSLNCYTYSTGHFLPVQSWILEALGNTAGDRKEPSKELETWKFLILDWVIMWFPTQEDVKSWYPHLEPRILEPPGSLLQTGSLAILKDLRAPGITYCGPLVPYYWGSQPSCNRLWQSAMADKELGADKSKEKLLN